MPIQSIPVFNIYSSGMIKANNKACSSMKNEKSMKKCAQIKLHEIVTAIVSGYCLKIK